MPIYDFQCKRCNETFERQVAGPRSGASCPGCRSRSVRRLPPLVRLRLSSPYAPTLQTGKENCAPTG